MPKEKIKKSVSNLLASAPYVPLNRLPITGASLVYPPTQQRPIAQTAPNRAQRGGFTNNAVWEQNSNPTPSSQQQPISLPPHMASTIVHPPNQTTAMAIPGDGGATQQTNSMLMNQAPNGGGGAMAPPPQPSPHQLARVSAFGQAPPFFIMQNKHHHRQQQQQQGLGVTMIPAGTSQIMHVSTFDSRVQTRNWVF